MVVYPWVQRADPQANLYPCGGYGQLAGTGTAKNTHRLPTQNTKYSHLHQHGVVMEILIG
jgi:hypothetical protein